MDQSIKKNIQKSKPNALPYDPANVGKVKKIVKVALKTPPPTQQPRVQYDPLAKKVKQTLPPKQSNAHMQHINRLDSNFIFCKECNKKHHKSLHEMQQQHKMGQQQNM